MTAQIQQAEVALIKIVAAFMLCASFGCAPDIAKKDELEKKPAAIVTGQEESYKLQKNQQETATDEPVRKEGNLVPGYNKVSSSVRTVIDAMVSRGVTTQNAKELGASSFSTPLVRVNEQGSIQTYVHVYSFRAEDIAVLESHGVIVEIVNGKLGIIQAWIPFNRIYEVAQLPFVKRITPPSYGIPQGRLDTLH